MQKVILKLYAQTQIVRQALQEQSAQDLVEYALVIAVVSLGLISSMSTLANAINNAMTTLGSKLNAAVV
jgi:pilus assembly protein Flp/PilA